MDNASTSRTRPKKEKRASGSGGPQSPQKNKKKVITMIAFFIVFGSLYGGGLLEQKSLAPGVNPDGTMNWNEARTLSYNFFDCISYAVGSSQGLMYTGICMVGAALLVIALFIISRKGSDLHDERGFDKSEKGTYGTSGWMEKEDVPKNFDILPVLQTKGTILGINPDDQDKIISLPLWSRLNKHIAIYGASGTGKSRCFVRGQIIQCVSRGESIIITDPKGEIFCDTKSYMESHGYNVKVFNLVDPTFSDSWNCLSEVMDGGDQIELMAQTFASIVIQNTMEGGKGDHFWDNAELNLLKALILIVILDKHRSPEQKNIGAVYELLTNKTATQLEQDFNALPPTHAALKPWNLFKQSSESVRGNVIIGLGSRIQVFQSPDIRRITQFPEIDLEAPAKEKCGYFVIMSDQNSTLDFLSSLFFSFLFIRLVKYADVYGKGGKCDVPVNFILDEFPNIGRIPDFTKKLSTIRSRDLRVAVIFQNIAQLQNRYPDGLWEEIIGNCDTQLFLGCTDQATAEFISKRTGTMTIKVQSQGLRRNKMDITGLAAPDYSENNSVGKREVLTPDEVLRLPNENALVILRGQKVIKVLKFDFSKHPESAKFVAAPIRDHVPEWKKNMELSRTLDGAVSSSPKISIDNADIEEDLLPPEETTTEKIPLAKPQPSEAKPKPQEQEDNKDDSYGKKYTDSLKQGVNAFFTKQSSASGADTEQPKGKEVAREPVVFRASGISENRNVVKAASFPTPQVPLYGSRSSIVAVPVETNCTDSSEAPPDF